MSLLQLFDGPMLSLGEFIFCKMQSHVESLFVKIFNNLLQFAK